jgi:hypothetical protein
VPALVSVAYSPPASISSAIRSDCAPEVDHRLIADEGLREIPGIGIASVPRINPTWMETSSTGAKHFAKQPAGLLARIIGRVLKPALQADDSKACERPPAAPVNASKLTTVGSHAGSQLAGRSQTTPDEGERVEAWWDSTKRPACDS